tara:strand:- start:394 stop:612 length:219 start_codon:yes stop_codon:yes gene_type:complete
MISESKYQQELDGSKVIYQISPNEEKADSIFSNIKNHVKEYVLKRIQPIDGFDSGTLYNFEKHWNIIWEEEE